MTFTTAPGAPPRRWWAPRPCRHDRPAEVLAVLQHARAIVEAGWVQNRWTSAAPATTTTATATATAATPSTAAPAGADGGAGSRACLVAAVALAVRARHPRADLVVGTGPALAFVSDVVFGGRAAGRSAPHHVRVARMRELARWNDERGRTRAEVVAILDQAAAAVVARVVEPA